MTLDCGPAFLMGEQYPCVDIHRSVIFTFWILLLWTFLEGRRVDSCFSVHQDCEWGVKAQDSVSPSSWAVTSANQDPMPPSPHASIPQNRSHYLQSLPITSISLVSVISSLNCLLSFVWSESIPMIIKPLWDNEWILFSNSTIYIHWEIDLSMTINGFNFNPWRKQIHSWFLCVLCFNDTK